MSKKIELGSKVEDKTGFIESQKEKIY